MFNFALKLRDPKGLIAPKGPSQTRFRTIRCTIDGTEILFKAPPHQNFRGARQKHEPATLNINSSTIFSNNIDIDAKDEGSKSHWNESLFFAYSWPFNGPWFTGQVASVHLSFKLIKIINYPPDISLFHPRSLEKIIGDHLSHIYSTYILSHRGHIQQFMAPVNWTPLSNLPVGGASLDVVSQEFYIHESRRHVYFPIFNDVLASLIFVPHRFGDKTKSEKDKLVDEQPLLEFINHIISSIRLNLSRDSLNQQAKALNGLEDTSIATCHPPLKWDNLNEDDRLKISQK